jgi:hypothetical protein
MAQITKMNAAVYCPKAMRALERFQTIQSRLTAVIFRLGEARTEKRCRHRDPGATMSEAKKSKDKWRHETQINLSGGWPSA